MSPNSAAPDAAHGRFDALAARLVGEHADNARFRVFAKSAGIETIADAYAAQAAFVAKMTAAGGARPVGYKIGLTSKRMQEMCGIDMPVGGVILDSRVHPSGTVFDPARFGRMGLEFEICVILGRDLPARAADYQADEIAAAVGSVAAAVEIVDDRHCDYAELDVLSLIADNSWNAGVVLGAATQSPANLTDCEGIVTRDGVEIDRGFGRDVLGSPLVPLQWLANHLRGAGGGLRKGDIVMTGSLIRTQFPERPGTYRFDVAGIGHVAIAIGG